MIDKSVVSYMHAPQTQYECGDCPMYIDERKLCVLHGFGDTFLVYDGCNFFVKGMPGTFGSNPIMGVTKQESGAARSTFGFSCKRCEHFDPITWDCSEVDRNSPGDDPGIIHPDACCNGWEADTVRALMTTEALREIVTMQPEVADVNSTGYR